MFGPNSPIDSQFLSESDSLNDFIIQQQPKLKTVPVPDSHCESVHEPENNLELKKELTTKNLLTNGKESIYHINKKPQDSEVSSNKFKAQCVGKLNVKVSLEYDNKKCKIISDPKEKKIELITDCNKMDEGEVQGTNSIDLKTSLIDEKNYLIYKFVNK